MSRQVTGMFKNQITPSIIADEYESCNFAFDNPVDSGGGVMVGNRIFPGDDTPRTFIECNLTNVEPPPGSTLTNCVTYVTDKYISGQDTVTIDGADITVDLYSQRLYGTYNSGTQSYDYLPAVRETEL